MSRSPRYSSRPPTTRRSTPSSGSRSSTASAPADEADAEGFHDIAARMRGVAAIEKEHEERYLRLLKAVQEGKVFREEGVVAWKCRNCGHIHFGTEAPEVCPVCAHPRAYFEVRK